MTNKISINLMIFIIFVILTFTGCSLKNDKYTEETTKQQNTPQKQYEFFTDDLESLNIGKPFALENTYIRNVTKPMNHYYIDENNILWGYGLNNYGQLGLGTIGTLDDFSSEPVKIAENVIHVDYSGEFFMIYLTSEGQLYGVGANLYGVMLEPILDDYDIYPEKTVITSPKLLMENVDYARCGYRSIVVLKKDGSVWTWGSFKTTSSFDEMLINPPTKFLTNAIYVSSGSNTAGAILKDHSLWTWGNNTLGQCGITSTSDYITTPMKSAEYVKMVWFDTLGFQSYLTQINSPFEPLDILISENTFIELIDNSLQVCGKDIGDTPKYVELYGDISAEDREEMGGSSTIIWSSEFMPLVIKERQH